MMWVKDEHDLYHKWNKRREKGEKKNLKFL